MTCESWQELILDKEYLTEVQQQDLDQHLSICIRCIIWAEALAEVETNMTLRLQAEVNPLALRKAVLHSLAINRRQNWMAGVPDFLETLGWSAVGILGIVGLTLGTNRANWLGNHLLWMGTAALAGTVAWAAVILWKEKSEPGFLP